MQVTPSFVWSNFYYPQISQPPTFELWIWCQKLSLYASIYGIISPWHSHVWTVLWVPAWWAVSLEVKRYHPCPVLHRQSPTGQNRLLSQSHFQQSRKIVLHLRRIPLGCRESMYLLQKRSDSLGSPRAHCWTTSKPVNRGLWINT